MAINGFGRIGRNFVRCWHGRGAASNLEVVAINDSGGVKQASHLLKYDSMLGTFAAGWKAKGCPELSGAHHLRSASGSSAIMQGRDSA